MASLTDTMNPQLKDKLEDLAAFLYPEGHTIEDGARFRDHESGVAISLTGLKRGVWLDGEIREAGTSRNLLALVARRFNYLHLEGWEVRAAREAGAWLESSSPSNGAQPTREPEPTRHEPAFDLPKPERPAPLPPQQQRKEPPMEREAPPRRVQYPPDFHREFPQDPDAEKGVLGSIAVVPDVLDRVIECGITAASFYIPANGEIFAAFVELRRLGKPLDFITLANLLKQRNRLDSIGGPAVLNDLFLFPTAANVHHYADIVLEKQLLRDAIKVCNEFSARSYEEQHDPQGLVTEMAAEMEKVVTGIAGSRKPLVSIMDVDAGTPDPRATVLGDRFLCMFGSMLFIGPSGIGKSSASVQQDILWSLGLPAFGIRPPRPLKILTIQAENDAEDLAEMRDGVLKGLKLTQAQIEQVRGNLFYETECGLTGDKFLAHVARRLARNQFDILRIDPFLAYLGADVNDAEATAAFLRSGLNPILIKYKCSCIINHHTPKVVNRDTSNWRGSDWMYAGAGSADITNWARAIMVIDPTHVDHIFQFIAAKRGRRIGWVDEDLKLEFKRPFCHASDGIYWREATDEDALQLEGEIENRKGGPRQSAKTADDVLRILPHDGSAIGINSIVAIAGNAGIGEKKTRGYLASLVHTGRAFQHRPIKDPTRPKAQEWRYGRKPEELV